MGDVYKAGDTRLNRVVAIKVLPSHLSSDTGLRERFERQARAASRLNHPHICTLHDVGDEAFGFRSPEQLEGQEADERSDIFAVGAVLYERLTAGTKAFTGKSPAS